MATRSIILHYHLFKNAGTSVDQMLKGHFGSAWVTTEFDMSGDNNTEDVERWITATPDAVAFSSHTMVGPLPQLEDVTVIPVIMLRDPLARIASAYRFERKQDADTWGANLAKEHDFNGYVTTRLDRTNDRQCRNFQVSRLATLCPGEGPELDRALTALGLCHDQGVLGRVESFAQFTTALTARLAPLFDGFEPEVAKANTTEKPRSEMAPDLRQTLEAANQDDMQLLAHADRLLGFA